MQHTGALLVRSRVSHAHRELFFARLREVLITHRKHSAPHLSYKELNVPPAVPPAKANV